MQYALIHVVNNELAGEWNDEVQADLTAWLEQTNSLKVNVQGSRLRPSDAATTVKVRDGELVLTDGPFIETKEQVAGYDVLECANGEEALSWAAKHPTARIGAIEVRALLGGSPARPLPEPKEGTLRYLMFVGTDPTVDPASFAHMEPVEPWVTETEGRGVRLFGDQLEPVEAARTVRVRQGQELVTDGPFAETKEQIAGFDILECTDLDEAIDIAAKHPMARFGILEIRPFWLR